MEDNWKHRSKSMLCKTCMFFIVKKKDKEFEQGSNDNRLGRCRKNAPTISGWPAIFELDWCGNHKLDENKI